VTHAAESEPATTARAAPPSFEAFRLAYEGAPVGFGIGDPRGELIFVNDQMARMLGRPRSMVQLRTFVDATHPDDRLDVRARMQALRRGDLDSYVADTRFVHADGRVVWARMHVRAERDPEGELTLLVAHAEDISEARRVEAALRASEARTSALLRHAREVVMIIGPAGTIRYASPAVEEVLGYDAATFGSTHPFELIHPDDRDAWVEGWRGVTGHPEARFALATRILHADGQYRWCEAMLRDLTGEPGIDGYLAHFQDVTERRRSEDDQAERALRDGLTGLANRALLVDRLRHALDRAERSGSVVALLFCDLARFMQINDSHGHAIGDMVLREVAARLRAVVRPSDTIARLGGDEFVVCCEDVVGGSEAVKLAERILATLRAPFGIDGRHLSLSTSVGIAVAGRGTEAPDDVLRSADAAMYAAKGNGRDRYEVFDECLRSRLRDRLETERGVRRALDDGELLLLYQPIFAVDGTEGPHPIVGLEALVRWVHPDRGVLGPSEFLAVAEQSGAAARIGDWVVRSACRQLQAWRAAGHDVPPVWVNLSAAQLASPDLVAGVAAILAEHQVPPQSLGFDIAETALSELEATPERSEVLEGLVALGCRLAIDDFGTGSTSLRSVHRYGVQALKLDPTLWQDRNPDPLVASAVAFGGMLGLTVIAEGVETAEQLAVLRSAGCHRASGYLLAPPGPADEVVVRLGG
jgi:diguanylate cyclase (GGDEF)-like protein/PAS domain S-box-containing protein